MGFHEVRFPTDISYGSKVAPGYSTNIIGSEGGAETRIARMSAAKRVYDVKYGIKSIDQLRAVNVFYLCRYGCAFGFRFQDPIDNSTAADHHSAASSTDQGLGSGDGVKTIFQLRKTYTSGSYSVVRNITKPVAGTVVVAVDGTPDLTVVVDTTLGTVTFSSPPANGTVVTAGCQFDVPVRFDKSVDTELYLSWVDFDQGALDSIPLVEIMDSLPVPSTSSSPGGAVEICPTSPITLTIDAVMWFIATTYISEVYLPDPANVPPGGPIFYVVNPGPNTLDVKTGAGGSTIVSLAMNDAAELLLSVDASNVRTWYAV